MHSAQMTALAADARRCSQRRTVAKLRAGWVPPLWRPPVYDIHRTEPAKVAALTPHGVVWQVARGDHVVDANKKEERG